jgi:hypothetical protein
MILKHNFTAKEMAELKKERINQKITIKEAREWATHEKERKDNYVGYEDAIKSTHAYQSILKEQLEKKMTKETTTTWQKTQDYLINLCVGISISLLALAAYTAWFK